jgi:hypothetical protein
MEALAVNAAAWALYHWVVAMVVVSALFFAVAYWVVGFDSPLWLAVLGFNLWAIRRTRWLAFPMEPPR